MKLRPLFRVATAIGCCIYLPERAAAQVRAETDAESGKAQLDEIIVTAQRRKEKLQRTPISVMTFSALDLEKRSVTNLRALQYFVPNMTFAPSQNVGDAAGNIFIRGIGQEDFVAGAEPGVGFYVDGVYVARTIGTLIDVLDIARIEVLRGPQGTLYGKNAVGGAINVISTSPDDQPSRHADLIAGNIGRVELRGVVNEPLTEKLFARVAAGRTSRNGNLKRLQPPFFPTSITETNHQSEGRDDSITGRLQLRWLANSTVTIDLAADASRRRGTQAATHIDAIDQRFGILPPVNFLILTGRLPGPEITSALATNDFLTSYAGGSNSISQNIEGIAATLTKDLGAHEVKLVAAHRRLRSHVATDIDGTWFAILHGDFAERHRQYSAELQATGTVGAFRYTAGLFAFRERARASSGRGVGRLDILYLCGCFYSVRPVLFYTRRDHNTDSYAAYGQGNLALAERLSATIGARFSYERKRAEAELVELDPDTFVSTDVILRKGANSSHWHSFTWRAGLEFQASPDVMFYASGAKGYKSGGFNTRPVVNLPNLGINRFAPETALTYELGVRSEWFERRLRLNATLFRTDYRGIQLRQQTFVDGFLTTLIENAARARVRGMEIEAVAKLGRRLTVNLAFGHLGPRYLDVGTVPGLTLDSRFQRTPRTSMSALLEYSVPVGAHTLTLHGDYGYRSREQFQLLASPFDQPGYGLLGARITLRDPHDRWSAALFATNLTNHRFRVAGRGTGLQEVGIANSVIGLPRQVAIELKAGF